MKHIPTFEEFLGESAINESEEWKSEIDKKFYHLLPLGTNEINAFNNAGEDYELEIISVVKDKKSGYLVALNSGPESVEEIPIGDLPSEFFELCDPRNGNNSNIRKWTKQFAAFVASY